MNKPHVVLSSGAILVAAAFAMGCGSPPPPAPPPPPPPAPVATVAVVAPPPPVKHKRKHPRVTEFNFDDRGLKLPGPVVFETDSDKLSPVSDEVLDVVFDYLEQKPEVTTLRIEGHTDGDGDPAHNQTLSEKRALAVARWLTGNGIQCSRLLPVGFGATRPIAPNTTPDNKAQNRRVAFFSAAFKGKPIAGKPLDNGGHIAGDACAAN